MWRVTIKLGEEEISKVTQMSEEKKTCEKCPLREGKKVTSELFCDWPLPEGSGPTEKDGLMCSLFSEHYTTVCSGEKKCWLRYDSLQGHDELDGTSIEKIGG